MPTKHRLSITYRRVDELIPYARNAKVHDDANVALIAGSIKEFGFNNPVLLDGDNGIIAGHGRVLAARKLGLEQVPCVELKDLTEAEKRAYILADNKLAERSPWDTEALGIELGDLGGMGVDLGALGFTEDEIAGLVGRDAPAVDDDGGPAVGEAPERCGAGDIWELGAHRLICGDSSVPATYDALLAGERADMAFTSPPYNGGGIAVTQGDIFKRGAKKKRLYAQVCDDDRSSDDYVRFASGVLDLCFGHVDGFIFWNVSYNANSKFEYIAQIQGHLPQLVEQICWHKTSRMPIKGTMMREWEPIYVFSTDGRPLGLDHVVGNLWQVSNTNCQAATHKACFPVELPARGIGMVRPATGIVLDPFLGSGSTLIACEQEGRKCRGIELDPHYCDVIIARWEKATGGTARRVAGA